MNWQINLQREVLTLTEQLGSNYLVTYAMLCLLCSAKEKDYSERWMKSYNLNPPKMFNILWRDKFSKDLIRMIERDIRAATQILTGVWTCLS